MTEGPWSDYAPVAASQGSTGPWSDYQAPAQPAPWHDYQQPAARTDVRVGDQSASFAPAPVEQPGMLSSIGQAAKAGVSQDIRNLAGLPGTLAGKPQERSAEPKPWEEPLSLADLAHPSRALPKITYQLASSGTTMGAGIAGGIVGGAVAPEAGPVGPLAGGAIAAGTMTAINQLTPLFAEEMRKPGADPEHAFNAALERAGQAGVFSGAGWAAFGARMFSGPVKNLLFQAFGVQPGMAVAEKGVENVEQGQPLTQGMGSAALQATVGTAVPLAGTEAAGAALSAMRGRPPPASAAPAPVSPAPVPGAPPGEAPMQTLERIGGLPSSQPPSPAREPPTQAPASPAPPRPRTVAEIVAQDGVEPGQAKLIQSREVDAIRAGQAPAASAPGTLREQGLGTVPVPAEPAFTEPEKQPGATPYMPVPKEPQRLIDYIRSLGGIGDTGGDVRDTIGGANKRPGLLNNRSGLPLDQVAIRAHEAGYFPLAGEDGPTTDDVLEAIDEEMRGRPHYSHQDIDAADAFNVASEHNAKVVQLAAQLGIPDRDLTPQQFMAEAARRQQGEAVGADEMPWFSRIPKPPAAGAPLFGEPETERQSRETPALLADRAALERQGQAVLPGMETSARQAQAARDQAGPRGGQAPANEGLFAPREAEQKPLFEKASERPEATPPHPAAIQAFLDNAQRIVGPNAKVVLHQPSEGGAIMVRHPDGTSEPVNGMALGRLILAAVQPDRTQWTLDHESVHVLRNLGVFSPKEWKALEAAAVRENWLKRYEIERLYGDHPRDQQIEEAIAQRFADGMANPARDPFVKRMIQAFHDFISRLRGVMAGHGFQTANDVFGRMASGEVGAREPGSGMGQRGPQSVPESAATMNHWLRTGEEAPQFQRVEDKRQEEAGGPRPVPPTGSRPKQGSFAQTVKTEGSLKRTADEIQSILSPTSRGAEAKRMEYGVREFTARLAQASQQSAHRLEDARRTVANYSPAEQDAQNHALETGQPLADPKLQAAAIALRGAQAEWLKKVQSLGYLADTIDDYMGHIYSNYREWKAGQAGNLTPEQVEARNRMLAAMKRPLRGAGEFLKQRTFDTLQDAQSAGLQPVAHNWVDMQLLKLRSMQRFYEGTSFAERMKQSGMATWVPVEGTNDARARGYKVLDDTIFQPRTKVEGQHGVVEHGNWMAPGPAADVFNNYMSRGLMQSIPTIYGGIRAAANALNGMQLGFSGFHATFEALDSMHSQTALGLQQLSRGDIGRGLKTMATAYGAPISTYRMGGRFMKAYLDPAQASPEMQAIVRAAVKGGARIGYDQFYRSTEAGPFFRSMKDLANPSGALREAWQMIKPAAGDPLATQAAHILGGSLRAAGRVIDTSMEPLMGHVVPRMKAGVMANLAKDWLDRNPQATEEQVAEAMTKAQDSVDNRMGQLVYDNLFWNKTLKDIAFITTRSVGWNVGTIRELGGAAVDTVAQARKLLRGRAPELTHRMAYAVAMTANAALLGSIMTYLATGKGPQSLMDYFYPPDGTAQPNGALNRLSVPGYIKDVIDWTHAPLTTAGNKVNPLVETAIELGRNTDYYGGIIYHSERDNPFLAYPEYLLNQMLPFSSRAIIKLHGQGATPLQQLMGFWGIQPAPQSIVNPAKGEAYNRRQENMAYKRRLKEPGRISLE